MAPDDFVAGDSAPATIVGHGRGPEPCRPRPYDQIRGSGQRLPRVQHRLERLLLEFQVPSRSVESRVSATTMAARAGLVVEILGELLDLVQQRGHRSVVRLQPVDGRAQLRCCPTHRRKQDGILVAVVGVHDLAVAQAVRPQLEQQAAALQILQPAAHLRRARAARDPGGQLPHRGEVAAEHVVHPAQLPDESGIAGGGARRDPPGRSALLIPSGRHRVFVVRVVGRCCWPGVVDVGVTAGLPGGSGTARSRVAAFLADSDPPQGDDDLRHRQAHADAMCGVEECTCPAG